MRFMRGRYGTDQLNHALSKAAVVLIVISLFGMRFLYPLALALLVIVYARTFSKDTYKRARENQKYMDMTWKLRCFILKQKGDLMQHREYHIYKCPGCRQKLRVPRGRGKISIHCSRCGTEFIKKS